MNQWWVEDDFFDSEGKHLAVLIQRRGWGYRLYLAEITGERYKIIEDVTGGGSWTAAQVIEVYDLGHEIKNSSVIYSTHLVPT